MVLFNVYGFIFLKALKDAGKHMEHSVSAAYVALLIGCILQQNEDRANDVKELIPQGSFAPLVASLTRFMEFLSHTVRNCSFLRFF